jgi:hypothetical protein
MALRDAIIKEMEVRLGGGMVDVELDPAHYNLALDKALDKYRQRSENAVEESFIHLRLQAEISQYTLPNEIIEVKDIYRRSNGVSGTTGNDFEPFEAQYLNTYMMHSGRAGGLAVYDSLAQHRETLGRLFGAEYTFTWNHTSHSLFLHRRVKTDDDCYLHVYNNRPEETLFADVYAKPWIKDYAFAHARLMLAEARGKFNTIAGPQGGTTLNADVLRASAEADLDKLEQDLTLYAEGSTGLGFVIG